MNINKIFTLNNQDKIRLEEENREVQLKKLLQKHGIKYEITRISPFGIKRKHN